MIRVWEDFSIFAGIRTRCTSLRATGLPSRENHATGASRTSIPFINNRIQRSAASNRGWEDSECWMFFLEIRSNL